VARGLLLRPGMNKGWWRRVVGLALAGLVVSGCFDFFPDDCSTDSDCGHGSVCVKFLGSSCEVGCNTGSDCNQNQHCHVWAVYSMAADDTDVYFST
jgi:hypothetical protein